MQPIPSIEAIAHKLEEIIAEHVEFDRPMNHRAALMADLAFDSLDLVETGFCIQEYFDFEFSDRNALEVLDEALGGGLLIDSGLLTELGQQMAFLRMPELAQMALPQPCSPSDIQRFISLESFARLVAEFLRATPQICPKSGQDVVLVDFRPRTAVSNAPVPIPNGDKLLDEWVVGAVAQIRQQA